MPPELPTWDQIRRKINQAAAEQSEWAGAPLPVHGIPLVIEPRYPFAKLNGFCFEDGPSPDPHAAAPSDTCRVVNSWYSWDRGYSVYICDDGPDTRRFVVRLPEHGGSRLMYWLRTIGASKAWSIEAEVRAMETLQGLIKPGAFEAYLLTGSFLETSPRSGVQYLFRKLRPTVALRKSADGGTRILAVLCLHPIGYYSESWAGTLCPTDDVISHLILMRGDEHHFWKKANAHPSWSAGAGI